jgi:hypothetical protein
MGNRERVNFKKLVCPECGQIGTLRTILYGMPDPETFDFEKIQVIQEFIQFQEENGWAVEYEAIDELDEDFEETEEEVESFPVNAHEPL